jgi:hypothetical protein
MSVKLSYGRYSIFLSGFKLPRVGDDPPVKERSPRGTMIVGTETVIVNLISLKVLV